MKILDEIRTDRLRLVPLGLEHVKGLFEIYSHPKAMRFMDSLPHVDVEATRGMVEYMLENDYAKWAVFLQDSIVLETSSGAASVGSMTML